MVSVVAHDPLARLILRLFRGRSWLLYGVVALGGVVCVYGIPALNGTLLLRPGFDSALSDVNSAIIWIVLVPIAARAYLRQLTEIPSVFDALRANGVTGLTEDEYRRFIVGAQRAYNRWWWWQALILIFLAPFWATFLMATAQSPFTWYYPSVLWPWFLYVFIQMVEIYAAVSYLIRYIITCRQLRLLLKDGSFRHKALLEPQFLHPDGLGGFGIIMRLVQNTLVIGGGVLIVFALESVNTARTVSGFSQGNGLAGFILVALIFATAIPYLVLYPLRLTLAGLRDAKHRLAGALSQHESLRIWSHMREVEGSPPATEDEHVEGLVRSLHPLGQISLALQTVPETLFELGQRSSQIIVLSTVLPPVVAIAYRVAADLWGWDWDALLRTIFHGLR
jgi:hypothetical protein